MKMREILVFAAVDYQAVAALFEFVLFDQRLNNAHQIAQEGAVGRVKLCQGAGRFGVSSA